MRLVGILRSDPGSQTAASAEGWDYPLPRLEAQVADLWDLTYRATGAKKPVTYPRPFGAPVQRERHGNAAGRPPEQVKELLRQARNGLSAPV